MVARVVALANRGGGLNTLSSSAPLKKGWHNYEAHPVIVRSPAHLAKAYSPECVEGKFSEVRRHRVLGSSPLEDASMLLPDLHPLASTYANVGLVRVDGVSAAAANHYILDRRNVSGLDDVVARPPIEAIQRGVSAVAD
jgi:hypothetical protein